VSEKPDCTHWTEKKRNEKYCQGGNEIKVDIYEDWVVGSAEATTAARTDMSKKFGFSFPW
jgi:hypothetical protein